MAATPIIASGRYYARGLTKIYYCLTIASILSPTRAEMNAGTDLSREVAEVNGWLISGGDIDTPDLASEFTGKIPGSTAVDESSINFYASSNGADARTILPRLTAGYILMLYGGDIAATKMDVFPIRVKAVGKPISLGDDPSTVNIQFTVTAKPAENVTVPA